MSHLWEQGFVVRRPAWHKLATVFEDYPGRPVAMETAGHDFKIVETPIAVLGRNLTAPAKRSPYLTMADGKMRTAKAVPSHKALVNGKTGDVLNVVNDSYTTIQNDVPWDVIDAIMTAGKRKLGHTVKYESGGTLDGGRMCFVTAYVDEPFTITGDTSEIYPYLAATWRHDGLGSFRLLMTSIRIECANTLDAAEGQSAKSGHEYVFRHTKNVHDRIEDAKMALRGIGSIRSDFEELANELAKIKVTPKIKREFVETFIPEPVADVVSDRVRANIAEARGKVYDLLDKSGTVPDAHRRTGYGLLMAGTEYLDHLRGYRNVNTYVGRTLLRPEPLKGKLVSMIRETAKVGR